MKKIIEVTKNAIEVYSRTLEKESGNLTADQLDAVEMALDNAEYLLERLPTGDPDGEGGEDIIAFMNAVYGTKYRYATQNKRLVDLLLKKYHPEEIKAVILYKYDEWVYTKNQAYLRPSTIFQSSDRRDNFANYLAASEAARFVVYDNGTPRHVNLLPEAARENVFSPHNEPMHPMVQMISVTKGGDNLMRSIRQYPIPNETWDDLLTKFGQENVISSIGRLLPKTEPIPYLAKHLANFMRAQGLGR